MYLPQGMTGPLNWRKATYSIANGDCAEVASIPGVVVVRDTKDPHGLVLRYTSDSWRSFISKARMGSLDSIRLWVKPGYMRCDFRCPGVCGFDGRAVGAEAARDPRIRGLRSCERPT